MRHDCTVMIVVLGGDLGVVLRRARKRYQRLHAHLEPSFHDLLEAARPSAIVLTAYAISFFSLLYINRSSTVATFPFLPLTMRFVFHHTKAFLIQGRGIEAGQMQSSTIDLVQTNKINQ